MFPCAHMYMHSACMDVCTHLVYMSLCAQANDPGGQFLVPYSALALKLTFPTWTDDLRALEFEIFGLTAL